MQRSFEPPEGFKRVNFHIQEKLLNSFKSVAAEQGKTMTDLLVEFIKDYVRGPRPKKSRR